MHYAYKKKNVCVCVHACMKEDYSTTRWCRTREVGHVNKHWQCTTHRLCNCLTATVMEVYY